jgi:hypothetical protein
MMITETAVIGEHEMDGKCMLFQLTLIDSGSLSDENNAGTEHWYQILVQCSNTSSGAIRQWAIRRTFDSFYTLDRQLHKCIFDRKLSLLPELRRDLIDEIGANVSSFPPLYSLSVWIGNRL